MKKVLMIAFHYPPERISSGIQRSLKFSHYLPDFRWLPHVLTAHPRVHQRTGDDQLGEIPAEVEVTQAFAVDTARHLSIAGRYPLFMALPDRWSFWWFGGVWSGLKVIRRRRPSALWSTYPIATAPLIALALHRITGLPWIADLRDSMTEDHYPVNPTVRRVYRWIERQIVKRAARVVFTTPGTKRMYAQRYPFVDPAKWVVIPNGYDEDNFTDLPDMDSRRLNDDRPVELVHSGILYPSERDPTKFFDALAELKCEGEITASILTVRLRATAHDDTYAPMLKQRNISDIVYLAPPVPYSEALLEMQRADGLLLFQGANCNHQIPAKLYEYLRAGRPLLALTDPAGDTAGVMLEVGVSTIAHLDDKAEIKSKLLEFLGMIRSGTAPLAPTAQIVCYSRREGTRALGRLLDEIVADDAGDG